MKARTITTAILLAALSAPVSAQSLLRPPTTDPLRVPSVSIVQRNGGAMLTWGAAQTTPTFYDMWRRWGANGTWERLGYIRGHIRAWAVRGHSSGYVYYVRAIHYGPLTSNR